MAEGFPSETVSSSVHSHQMLPWTWVRPHKKIAIQCLDENGKKAVSESLSGSALLS